MHIKVEQSEKIYRGRAFDVRRDQIRLANGHLKQRDIVEHTASVVIVPIDESSLVWFVRQYRYPVGKYLLELPAGVMEDGETPQFTALRETREEIGMAPGSLIQIGEFFLAPGYSTEYMYVFLAQYLSPSPLQPDEDEDIEIEKLPLQTILDLQKISRIQDAKTIAAIYLAHLYLLSQDE